MPRGGQSTPCEMHSPHCTPAGAAQCSHHTSDPELQVPASLLSTSTWLSGAGTHIGRRPPPGSFLDRRLHGTAPGTHAGSAARPCGTSWRKSAGPTPSRWQPPGTQKANLLVLSAPWLKGAEDSAARHLARRSMRGRTRDRAAKLDWETNR